MLSPDEFVGAGEVFCVSDLAETVSLSSVGDGDKTSIVEVIVGFCSDIGALVDISVVDVPFGERICRLGFPVCRGCKAGHVPTDGSLV